MKKNPKKMKNCIELDYPGEKLEIIVVSDASSDNTDKVVSRYGGNGIKLLRMDERGGKTPAQKYAGPFSMLPC